MRNITESTRGHGVIVRKGWRIVLPIFDLNCWHIQTLVLEMQAVAKATLLQQQQITRSLLDAMKVLKKLQTSSQFGTTFQLGYRGGSGIKKLQIERI